MKPEICVNCGKEKDAHAIIEHYGTNHVRQGAGSSGNLFELRVFNFSGCLTITRKCSPTDGDAFTAKP